MAEASMKFILEGLGCANCATKIEERVSQLKGVGSTSLDFMTRTLMIQPVGRSPQEITRDVVKLVGKIEPDVVVKQPSEVKGTAGKETGGFDKKAILRLCLSGGTLAAALLVSSPFGLKLGLFVVSYLLAGGDVLWRALRNLFRGEVFDENFLMSIATVGAFVVGEYPEGVAVMIFYQIGELFQKAAVHRSRQSIAALMDIRPDYANLKTSEGLRVVEPGEVAVGDLIVVKPGERIPLDGRVEEGSSSLNLSALTGEALPKDVTVGDSVLSGGINNDGLLVIRVEKVFGESTVSKILDLVQNASSKKTQTENFITRFSRYYTPAVVLMAALISFVPPIFSGYADFHDWLYKGLSFLVVSCPCALVISVPLGFFGGIGLSSRRGILMKGSNYLDALNRVDTVVFDKTGTLTKGNFKVADIQTEEGVSREKLLEYAAYAEHFSSHPIAQAVRDSFPGTVRESDISHYQEIAGHGIQARIQGVEVLLGNRKHMEAHSISVKKIAAAGTVLYAALDGNYAGCIVIADELKPDSRQSIRALKELGVSQTVMLTGDVASTAQEVAGQLGIGQVYAELLPHQKLEQVEQLSAGLASRKKLLFVGDGINDAPVLARADIGVSMGNLSSDAAIEAADIVLMTDQPSKLAEAMVIARKTRRVVNQNIIFSLGVKGLVLLLVAFGFSGMWGAVFADVGVTLLAVLNATRLRQMKVDVNVR